MSLLRIEGLTKSFGDVDVLKGIDLELERKELLFIIGPSGSGKSTLLRCCNRLEEKTGGVILLDGVDVADAAVDVNQLRRRVGMVFQSFNLYPHMSALGNVSLALRKTLGRSKSEAEEAARFYAATFPNSKVNAVFKAPADFPGPKGA